MTRVDPAYKVADLRVLERCKSCCTVQHSLNPDYLREIVMINGIFRFKNCGGLALLSPTHFQFGKELMQVVVNSLHAKDFDRYTAVALWRWAGALLRTTRTISQIVSWNVASTTLISMRKQAKEKILERLVVKTRNNARYSVEIAKGAPWKEDRPLWR
jgi:hypothetical protein